jgi:hypothetical protein
MPDGCCSTIFAELSRSYDILEVHFRDKVLRFVQNISPLILMSLFLFPAKALAQGTQVPFGQNRVQYHDFDWLSYESDNFITYYYPGGQELGKFIVLAAEDRLQDLEDRLDFRINDKIEILVYNDITDLAQTNIGLDDEQYNLGGTNKIIGSKLFLYYDGNHANMVRALERGLAEIYIRSMMVGGNFAEVLQNAVFLNLPNWFSGGLASFIGEEWNTELDDQLRKYFLTNPKASFNKLAQTQPDFAGHALWHYINERYGRTAIQNILYLTRINRSVTNGFLFAIGVSSEDVIDNWNEYYRFHSRKDTMQRAHPAGVEELKSKIKKKRNITQLRLAPDGKSLAYASHKGGSFKVFIQDLEKKKTRRVFKGGFKSNNYPFDNSYPLLSFNPSGTTLMGVHEKRDQIKSVEYDILKKKKLKDDIRGLQRIYSIGYAPDGRTLVLSAQNRGQTDLYTYFIPSKRLVQLTYDIFDDLEPVMIQTQGVNGILFSSNRPNENTFAANMDTILPIGRFNIYFYNMDNPDARLVKVTDQLFGYEHAARRWNEEKYLYLSDENGIKNIYTGHLDSILLRVDTVLVTGENGSEEVLELKPVYSFKASNQPLTNLPFHILEMDVAPRLNQIIYLQHVGKKPQVYSMRLKEPEVPKVLPPTTYRTSWNNTLKIERMSKMPERVTVEQLEALRDLDTLLLDDVKYFFESKFNYTLKSSKEKSAAATAVDSLGDEAAIAYAETVLADPGSQPATVFRPSKAVAYRAKFYSEFLTTQLDNSVMPFTYQSFALNGAQFDYPDLSGMISFGTKDLMEDHKISGGFRLPGNFRGSELYLTYENLKKRLDKRILFYRRSNRENYGLVVNNIFLLPVIGKQKTNFAEVRLSYPFDVTKSLRLYGGYRNDRLLLAYTDSITLGARVDVEENWSFLRLEFVHDNSKEIQLNIMNGFRYKFYTEYFRNFSEGNSNLFSVGYDIRHYTTIHKNIIWANRLAGATSFGQRKIIYYLGGVDTWLNPRFNNEIPINPDINYAFQAQATNMRGFAQNIRNGNSYMVLNSEIRFPIFSYLSAKPIKSSFIRNFQVVPFFDIGAAYKGLTPFDEENPFSNEQVTPGGDQTPVVINVDYYRNPTVMGTGFGLRTTLLGYFIRIDAAWGIDGRIVNKTPQWLFSFSKDF